MTTDQPPVKAHKIRVVVADDDAFTVSLVAEGLRAEGFEVVTASTVAAAWGLVVHSDPHALVSDLNFGPGESGASLLGRVSESFPWVGLVVLTSHQSPALAVEDSHKLPTGIVYLVKSHLRQVDELGRAVLSSISGDRPPHPEPEIMENTITITAAQAEVLRMLAEGASTKALAEHRGTTVRAAETMLSRLFAALGADNGEQSNPRVTAVRIWQQGRINVK